MFYYPPYHTAYSWTAERKTPKRASAATTPVVSNNINCVNKRNSLHLRSLRHNHCHHLHQGHRISGCANPLSLRRSVSSDNVSDISSVTAVPGVATCSLSRQGSQSSSRKPFCTNCSPGANVASSFCPGPRPSNIRRQQYQLARVHSAEEHPQAAAKFSCSTASSAVLASSASATSGVVSNVLVVCGDSSGSKLQQTTAAHPLPSGRSNLGNTLPNSIDLQSFPEPQQIDLCEYVYPPYQQNHRQHPQQRQQTTPETTGARKKRRTSSSSTTSKTNQPSLGCLTHVCHFLATFCGLLSLLAYSVPFSADSWVIVSEPVPEEGSMSSSLLTVGMASSAAGKRQAQHQSSTTLASSTVPPLEMKGQHHTTTRSPDVMPLATTGPAVSTLVISKTVIHIGIWTMCPYIFTRNVNRSSSSAAIHRQVPCPLSRPGDLLSLIPEGSWPPFDYSSSVLNRLRISTPFLFLGFLFLPVAATTLLFFPLCKRGNRNLLLAGAAFLFGGLSLGTGLTMYISILGEEIKLLPHTSRSRVNYRFGWPFFSAVGAFTLAELSALLSALVYLRRMSALGHAACFLQQSRDPLEDAYLAAVALEEVAEQEESSLDEQTVLELLKKENEKAQRRQSVRQQKAQNDTRKQSSSVAHQVEESANLLPLGPSQCEGWCSYHHVCPRAVSSYVLVHSGGEETGSDVTGTEDPCLGDEKANRKSVHFLDSEDIFTPREEQSEMKEEHHHQCHHHHHHHRHDHDPTDEVANDEVRHTCGNFGQTVAIMTSKETPGGNRGKESPEGSAMSTFTPRKTVCSQSPSSCTPKRPATRKDADGVIDLDSDLC